MVRWHFQWTTTQMMEPIQNHIFDGFSKHHHSILLRHIYWFVLGQSRCSIANTDQISTASMPCYQINIFYLFVSISCKYHQVLFHAVQNFFWNFRFSSFLSKNFCWDGFVTKIRILYCKVVTSLFTGIKEHILGNNVVTKYIFHSKTGHCINNTFALPSCTVCPNDSETELVWQLLIYSEWQFIFVLGRSIIALNTFVQ